MATSLVRPMPPASEPAPGQPFDSSRAPGESGIAPARTSHVAPSHAARAEAHLLAAESANTRADANLSSLFRSVQHLSAGVSSAREANDQLSTELELLRHSLTAATEQRLELSHQIQVLERSLLRGQQEAELERNFLIEQQDTFIVSLCVDHESELSELQQEAARASAQQDQLQSELERTRAERDEARAAVVRIASERDQAMIELSRSRPVPSSRAGSPILPAAASGMTKLELEELVGSAALASGARLQAGHVPASLNAFIPRAHPVTYDSVPPEELQAALTSEQSRVTAKPPLKSKPDPSTRPLVGYSLAGHAIEEERFSGANPTSRPPDR